MLSYVDILLRTKDGLRVTENFGAVIKTDNGKSSELQLTEVESDDDDCSIQCSLKNNFGNACSEAKLRTLSRYIFYFSFISFHYYHCKAVYNF